MRIATLQPCSALSIGIASQLLGLAAYIFLARWSPDSGLKHTGYVIVGAGGICAAWLLHRLSAKAACSIMTVLALAAPLFSLFRFLTPNEMLSDMSGSGSFIKLA